MKFLENLDLAKVIHACGDFVVQLDKHPHGARVFVAMLLIVCASTVCVVRKSH